jgi:hypothetical protein
MSNIGLWAQKAMLDLTLRGAAVTQPTNVYVGLALGAPTSIASSEVATGSGYARQSPGFGPAATPASSGSASNSGAATYGPFSSSAVISGLFITDSNSSGAGNQMWFGNLATPRTPLPGDSLILNAGAVAITIA